MSLTDKQSRFVEAYLLEPNGTKAAIAAGYAENSAAITASRLLSHAKVVAALAERRGQVQAATGVTPERVIAELARIGFADIRDVITWQSNAVGMYEDKHGEEHLAITNQVALKDSRDLSPDVAAAISEISQTKDGAIRIKLHPKMPALVKIGENLGLFRPANPPGPGAGRTASKGKKEAAQDAAQNAGEGTDWGDDLRTVN